MISDVGLLNYFIKRLSKIKTNAIKIIAPTTHPAINANGDVSMSDLPSFLYGVIGTLAGAGVTYIVQMRLEKMKADAGKEKDIHNLALQLTMLLITSNKLDLMDRDNLNGREYAAKLKQIIQILEK